MVQWNVEQVNDVMVDIDSLFFPYNLGSKIEYVTGGGGGLNIGCPYGKINMQMWFQNLEPT